MTWEVIRVDDRVDGTTSMMWMCWTWSLPRRNSASTRCDPNQPAPPQTKTVPRWGGVLRVVVFVVVVVVVEDFDFDLVRAMSESDK